MEHAQSGSVRLIAPRWSGFRAAHEAALQSAGRGGGESEPDTTTPIQALSAHSGLPAAPSRRSALFPPLLPAHGRRQARREGKADILEGSHDGRPSSPSPPLQVLKLDGPFRCQSASWEWSRSRPPHNGAAGLSRAFRLMQGRERRGNLQTPLQDAPLFTTRKYLPT